MKKITAAVGLLVLVAPLIAGNAQAAKHGTCKVVYYGGPAVCESQTGS